MSFMDAIFLGSSPSLISPAPPDSGGGTRTLVAACKPSVAVRGSSPGRNTQELGTIHTLFGNQVLTGGTSLDPEPPHGGRPSLPMWSEG